MALLCGGIASCRSWAVAALTVAVAMLAMDPLRLRLIADYPEFLAGPVEVRPFHRNSLFPRDAHNKLRRSEIRFAGQVIGPESIVFDPAGRGPYVGMADGRILRYDGPDSDSWSQFATVYPNGSQNCTPRSPPAPNIAHEQECGRPLGMRFMKSTGQLYIADSYYGLLVVEPEGGQAKRLVSEAEGSKFAFTNDLDISSDGIIYFTVTSDLYPRKVFLLTALSGDRSGRLLRYDSKTGQVDVLCRGLQSPNGVTLSKDGSFLVFCETGQTRLNRYWLKGEKAGSLETFAELPGFPDNVRANHKGQFWVAIYCQQSRSAWTLLKYPWLRRALLQLPLSFKTMNSIFLGTRPHAMVILFDEQGQVLEVLEDETGEKVKFVSEVEERDGKLWMGSVIMPHIAVYTL